MMSKGDKLTSSTNESSVMNGSSSSSSHDDGVKRDPPPVFTMPDGQSYLHVNRNGLIFGCATAKNVSPCTVIEVSRLQYKDHYDCLHSFLFYQHGIFEYM